MIEVTVRKASVEEGGGGGMKEGCHPTHTFIIIIMRTK